MYEIILEEPAKQFIRDLSKEKQKRILSKISELKENPWLGKRLKGKLSGLRSLRVDSYRVVYNVREIELVVLVLKAGSRDSVY